MKNIILAGIVLTTSLQVFADVRDEVKKSFVVSEGAEFRLSNVNGEVDVQGWDKNEIQVVAIIQAKDQDARDRIEVDMKENSRGVSVETQYKKSSWGNNSGGSVNYQVKLPHGTKLSEVESVNGSIVIEDVSGEMKLTTVNGSIDASGLTKDSEVTSVNGGIEVKYAGIADSLRNISVETVNGRVKLVLPKAIGADIEVETMHGSIRNDFGLEAKKNAFIGRSLEGTIGDGRVRINIETVNGSVSIDN